MERRGEKGRGAKVLHTDRHTDIKTYRPSDEVGPKGTIAPKNISPNLTKS